MTEIEELYQNYFHDVYLYLLSLTHDKMLSEDLTSETFLKAIKNIDSFRGDSDIRVWLCQIGKNSYYSWLRKNRRMASLEEVPEKADPADLEKEIADKESSYVVAHLLAKGFPASSYHALRDFIGILLTMIPVYGILLLVVNLLENRSKAATRSR